MALFTKNYGVDVNALPLPERDLFIIETAENILKKEKQINKQNTFFTDER